LIGPDQFVACHFPVHGEQAPESSTPVGVAGVAP